MIYCESNDDDDDAFQHWARTPLAVKVIVRRAEAPEQILTGENGGLLLQAPALYEERRKPLFTVRSMEEHRTSKACEKQAVCGR